jgi:UDP-N-acetylglucosamine 2-epimerase (non-hydrolysing)
MSRSLKLVLVAGARPNFMKVAPLIHAIHRHNASERGTRNAERGTVAAGGPVDALDSALRAPHSALKASPLRLDRGEGTGEVSKSSGSSDSKLETQNSKLSYRLVHTGQHYDAAMSEVFFQELGIPAPNVNLGVGSGSHAVQTANVMIGFEKVCQEERPDWVIVFGDVNSTVACTLVAVKMGIRVAHVEAGLRSFDRTMPEEINRIVTDSIADLLLTPSEDANENLRREGVPDSKIALVGNIMIDSLMANLEKAQQSTALERFSVEPGSFVYVTLHRPANVDDRASLSAIAAELKKLSHQFPVVFPIHPRTRKMFSEFGIDLEQCNGFRLAEPVGYHDSVCLTRNARLVLTDSGGLQEEATWFQTPCLTLRPNTERPVTITLGSNRLTNIAALPADLQNVLATKPRLGQIPPLWDGKTAERIVDTLLNAERGTF